MKRIAVCLLTAILLTVPLTAQYAQRTMATDLTGSELIFSTTWTLQGEPYNPYSKLIQYRSGQLRTLRSVLAERDPATGCLTNMPSVTRPDMSLDGMRYSYTQTWPRIEGCGPGFVDTGEVRNDTGELVFSGRGTVALSANGRWARYESGSSFTLANLDTGESEDLGTLITFGVKQKGRQVANDGTTVIAFRSPVVYVKRPGLEREFVTLPAATFDTATIADSGNFALLQTRQPIRGPMPELWWFDIGARVAFPIATAEEGALGPSFNTDATRMVFLSAANWSGLNPEHRFQVYLMDLTTGTLTQLTKGNETAAEANISGDGQVVFARSPDGSIQRIAVETGGAEEIVPPTPEISSISLQFVPGSRHYISNIYLPENRPALITIAGAPANVLLAEGTTLDFIVPSGVALGKHEFELNYEDSPFQSFKFPVTLVDFAPRFRNWGPIAQIWHDSNGTAVWEASPARSGEVIEALLEGLGATDAEGRTLIQMKWSISYGGGQEGQPVEVLASRKSPYEGEEGLYRVKMRLPQLQSFNGVYWLLCSNAQGDPIAINAPLAVVP